MTRGEHAFVALLLLAALIVKLVSGCASMLAEIPGRGKIGDCYFGPVYVYKDEIICDRWDLTSFHAYKWKTLDLPSACAECRLWAW